VLEPKLAVIGSIITAPREALRQAFRGLRYVTRLSAIFCGLAGLGALLAGHREAAEQWAGPFLLLLLIAFYVGQRADP